MEKKADVLFQITAGNKEIAAAGEPEPKGGCWVTIAHCFDISLEELVYICQVFSWLINLTHKYCKLISKTWCEQDKPKVQEWCGLPAEVAPGGTDVVGCSAGIQNLLLSIHERWMERGRSSWSPFFMRLFAGEEDNFPGSPQWGKGCQVARLPLRHWNSEEPAFWEKLMGGFGCWEFLAWELFSLILCVSLGYANSLLRSCVLYSCSIQLWGWQSCETHLLWWGKRTMF